MKDLPANQRIAIPSIARPLAGAAPLHSELEQGCAMALMAELRGAPVLLGFMPHPLPHSLSSSFEHRSKTLSKLPALNPRAQSLSVKLSRSFGVSEANASGEFSRVEISEGKKSQQGFRSRNSQASEHGFRLPHPCQGASRRRLRRWRRCQSTDWGGSGRCWVCVGPAKVAVSSEKKPQIQAEAKQVDEDKEVAPKVADEAHRREVLLAAVLVVSLSRVPNLLLSGILGAAAVKVLQMMANEKRERHTSLAKAETENDQEMALLSKGAVGGCNEGAAMAQMSTESEYCEGGRVAEGVLAKQTVSVSEKGRVQGRKGNLQRLLLRSLSDTELIVSKDDTKQEVQSGVPTEQLLHGDSMRELVDEMMQGEKKEGFIAANMAGRSAMEGFEGVVRWAKDVPLPDECHEHEPCGTCLGSLTFSGTAVELFEWLKGEIGRNGLPEHWVLAIMKQGAEKLKALPLRGLCVGSLSATNLVLERFPLMERPITTEHMHLNVECCEMPGAELWSLTMRAMNVDSLGLTAIQLLGLSMPLAGEYQAKISGRIHEVLLMLRTEPLARPTAEQLCALLAEPSRLLLG